MLGTSYARLTDEQLDAILSQPDPPPPAIDERLSRDMADLAEDPLEWVLYSFPWGAGELEGYDGPDAWQADWLRRWGEEIKERAFNGLDPVMPYMATTTSGHGVGKTALVAWAAWFIISTRPMSKGIVSANSIPQLETKTWAEIAKWKRRLITGHWFKITSSRGNLRVVHHRYPEDWRFDGMAWSKDNPAAFAGLHAATSSPWFIFDEASEVARVILETAQGGLTDGEPFFFMFSNPTEASGFFYDSHHGMAHRYQLFHVDSRTARMTNKALIQQWIADRGIDSDFVKVRVLGEFPLTGTRQFIETHLVSAAASADREPAFTPLDPVIIGVDVARFGGDENTIYVRRGRDARSYPAKIFRGQDHWQTALEIKKIALELLPDAINVDAGGYGASVVDDLRNLKIPNVNEINFGSTRVPPDGEECANMATYMMWAARNWLKQANTCIPDDPVLKRQLTARQYTMTEGTKITKYRVDSKEELRKQNVKAGGDSLDDESPDRSDGFCLTFARDVGPRNVEWTRAAMAGEAPSNVVGVDYER